MTEIVFNSYSITEAGRDFLATEPLPSIALPSVRQRRSTLAPTLENEESSSAGTKLTRRSKGTHLLPELLALLSSSEMWYDIEKPDDYQYPGKFRFDHPKRLGFAADITKLPFYTKEDEHFLFNDIQISKGKPRAPSKITVSLNGTDEELYYRIAPCGGVRCCPAKDCSYCISVKERRLCPQHPEIALVSTGSCPVEFVYVWPTSSDDKRRWHSGIVRRDDMKSNNLHNHPLPGPTKVPAKVVHDIQHAMSLDSSLKTHDILTGNKRCLLQVFIGFNSL